MLEQCHGLGKSGWDQSSTERKAMAFDWSIEESSTAAEGKEERIGTDALDSR